MNIPVSTAIDAAMLRQNMTLSVIKQNAEQGKAIAQILDNSVKSAPINGSRGTSVNFSV